MLPTSSATNSSATNRHDPTLSRRASTGGSSVIRDLLRLVDRPGMLSLAGGLPAPELLPVARIDQASRRVLAESGARALQYAPTEGMDELRSRVGADLQAPLDNIIITTGSQQAIDLLSRCLVDPGDVVVVESPGYLGALQAFIAADADLHAVPADGDGLCTQALESQLRAGLRPRLVYVVATFQNPSGATLSPDRRRHLAALAEEFGFVIVEDDPYGELRFRGDRPTRLRELTDRVVTLGTASKTIAPGLRVGWAAAPGWLQPALVRAKQATDLHTSPLTQLIVADILTDHAFMAGHLSTVRSTYQRRAETLVGALRSELGTRIEVADPTGGMFAWVHFVDGTDTSELLVAALAANVSFVPGSAFVTSVKPGFGGPASSHVRACFATLDEEALTEAARRLATVSSRQAPDRSGLAPTDRAVRG